jgi:hypothetical protein
MFRTPLVCLLAAALMGPARGAAQEADVTGVEDAPPDRPRTVEARLEALERLQAERDARIVELESTVESQREQLEAVESAQAEAALLGELSMPVAESEAEKLRIYGFVDFGINYWRTGERSALRAVLNNDALSFVLGNLNLYFDAQPLPDWRTMLELRFTNLPHGFEQPAVAAFGTSYSRVDATTFDSTSPSFRNRIVLGNIVIERAWTEWTPLDQFHLQVGYFFTPFGIWNLDHATPTLISLILPHFQVDQVAPLRQLGMHAYGTQNFGDFDLGYHLFVSNGRTVGQFDLTNDKAVGGRMFVRSAPGALRWTIGASGYWGTFEDAELNVTSLTPLMIARTFPVQGEEGVMGVDVSLDYQDFRLRAEYVLGRRWYWGAAYPLAFSDVGLAVPNIYVPSFWDQNGYLLASYRLPWLGLEPYVFFEYEHHPSTLMDTVLTPSLGLNVYFNAQVQLKLQWNHTFYVVLASPFIGNPADNDVDNFQARLVMAL